VARFGECDGCDHGNVADIDAADARLTDRRDEV
jgi:hypothetical protein